MIRPTLNTIGLRCPSDGERLVSRDNRWYRCTERSCNRLYRLSVDPERGIVLTLTEERFRNRRRDASAITSLPVPYFPASALSLTGEES